MLFKNATIMMPAGTEISDLSIENGIITKIGEDPSAYHRSIIDATRKMLYPAFIDCHVHFREPGFEHKATMQTEAAAALAGGVHTVCEMPNTNPPTVTVAALADKVRRASEVEGVDIRFFFGMTQPVHLANFKAFIESSSEEAARLRERCSGVKLYLDHSTGNQKVEAEMIGDVFEFCAQHDIVVVAHCEDPAMNSAAAAANTSENIEAHSEMRPAESEVHSITNAIALAEQSGAHLHIAHLSTAGGIDAVRKAKERGSNITCEVAPHHLFLTTNDYEYLGAKGKMNPPLRSLDDRDALWHGIQDGTVDCISTDHAPHTIEEKSVEKPLTAPSGVPGVETMIPLLLSVAAGHWPNPSSGNPVRSFSYQDILRLCFTNPNDIFKLGKSQIIEGAPADVVLVDPLKEWTIRAEKLHSKCGWTPFEDWTVVGSVSNL